MLIRITGVNGIFSFDGPGEEIYFREDEFILKDSIDWSSRLGELVGAVYEE
ncbi:MAG: hypothetical protein LBN30_03650 [Oscillospiraceae bacterium]|jgi:hypothetical protein|nr:hypothetical protein [Oscillospiraceae bacterium]